MLAELIDFDYNDDESRETWALHHSRDHQAIWKAIQAQGFGNLPEYPLSPVPWFAWKTYEQTHQQVHNDMNKALSLSGSDLTGVQWSNKQAADDWNQQHFSEHQAARSKLGI